MCARPLLNGELYDDTQRRVRFINPIAIAILHKINSSLVSRFSSLSSLSSLVWFGVHLFFALVELEFLRVFLRRLSMYRNTLGIL